MLIKDVGFVVRRVMVAETVPTTTNQVRVVLPKKMTKKVQRVPQKEKTRVRAVAKGKMSHRVSRSLTRRLGGVRVMRKKMRKKMIPNPKMQVMTRASKRLKTALARMKTTLGFPKSWSLK